MDMELAGGSPESGDNGDKIPMTIELCMRVSSVSRREEVVSAFEDFLMGMGSLVYTAGPIELPTAEEDPYLHANVESAAVADLGE
jgi:hypothetical protein